ncbi:response regulator transcription factor [Luteolibacter algae]|uniref:Response regulator transcription factor n=1 Tax=Luteolibacter algae TaxID=454151 RepID=A0ABW5D6P3_9BACT
MIESPTILVIEDDPAVRTGIVDTLEYGGYKTIEAADGHSGMKMALQSSYRLLLLDIVMPGPSGFEILAALKKSRPGQAVIMLSARGEEQDRVKGLVGGADDYVVKPFSMKELLARVDAVLRRTHERPSLSPTHNFHGAVIDLNECFIKFSDGSRAEFSEKENSLLRYLIGASGRTVTRAEILRQVWNLDPERIETRTIDMHMAHLRSKLGKRIASCIITERGKGYRFIQPEKPE